jgi:hypothetical protein
MRVFIRDTATREFYQGNGRWTKDQEKALVCKSATEAFDLCKEIHAKAEVLLTFGRPSLDISLPVR